MMITGQMILEFIVNNGLVWVDPEIVKEEYSGGLLIWSANAAEQIQAFIDENKCECDNGKLWADDRKLSFTPCPKHYDLRGK